MHRRWMSLPLLSTCVAAFYPYREGESESADKSKRFIPYHPVDDQIVDATLKIDLKRLPRRDNKFSVVLSQNVDEPNALPVNQDGSDFSYFSTMKFGSKGQPMYMLIDTGSGNTWVMGEDCSSTSCTVHNLFGEGDSDTLKTTTKPWNVSYGTGKVSGTVASDKVEFANFSLSLGFGLATTASDDFLSYPMDGLLGLGRNPTNQLGVPSFMDTLANQGQLASKVVGIHLHRGANAVKDGEILFGGIDTSKVDGDISYTKTANDKSWEIAVDDVFVNSEAVEFRNKGAMLDTGSSYILMPPADAQAIHDLIPGSAHNGESFTVPCNTTDDIQFSFSGQKWSVSPLDWVRKTGDGTTCASNIIGHQAFGADDWILGAVFLKNVYAVFDFDQASIGLAKLASPSSTSTPTSPTASSTASPTSTDTAASSPTSTGSSGSVGNPFDLSGGDDKGGTSSATRFTANTVLSLPCIMILAFLVGILV